MTNDTDDTRSFEDVQEEVSDEDLDLDPVAAVQEQRGKNVVHESALRELIEQWRERAKFIDNYECRSVKENCADELEELLNE